MRDFLEFVADEKRAQMRIARGDDLARLEIEYTQVVNRYTEAQR